MTIYRKTVSIILSTAAAALLWGTVTADAAMPVPQRKPAVTKKAVTKKPAAAAAKPAAKPERGPVRTEATTDGRTASRAEAKAEEGSTGSAGDKAMPVQQDVDENLPLPPYPRGARMGTGEMRTYIVGEEDTFVDIARHFGLGYVELRAANPDVDPWAPMPGEVLVIPTFKLLPRARQDGIVVNLGEMRLYYFRGAGTAPLSYALGIGREGLETPVGETHISRKQALPSWYPTKRMREEKKWLPAVVGPGNQNPLGTHAMYLGFPEVLIHGSNKPWGIGRRVSSGCMRMYPEDITTMFSITPVGTRVTVVNQPIKLGWVGDGLYLEANPSLTQTDQVEIEGRHSIKGMTDGLKEDITNEAGDVAGRIDWSTVNRVVRERRGYPVLIATRGRMSDADDAAPRRNRSDFN